VRSCVKGCPASAIPVGFGSTAIRFVENALPVYASARKLGMRTAMLQVGNDFRGSEFALSSRFSSEDRPRLPRVDDPMRAWSRPVGAVVRTNWLFARCFLACSALEGATFRRDRILACDEGEVSDRDWKSLLQERKGTTSAARQNGRVQRQWLKVRWSAHCAGDFVESRRLRFRWLPPRRPGHERLHVAAPHPSRATCPTPSRIE
jgi:hypothetical protein